MVHIENTENQLSEEHYINITSTVRITLFTGTLLLHILHTQHCLNTSVTIRYRLQNECSKNIKIVRRPSTLDQICDSDDLKHNMKRANLLAAQKVTCCFWQWCPIFILTLAKARQASKSNRLVLL